MNKTIKFCPEGMNALDLRILHKKIKGDGSKIRGDLETPSAL